MYAQLTHATAHFPRRDIETMDLKKSGVSQCNPGTTLYTDRPVVVQGLHLPPSKHYTFTQCWVIVGPTSEMVGHLSPRIGSMYGVCKAQTGVTLQLQVEETWHFFVASSGTLCNISIWDTHFLCVRWQAGNLLVTNKFYITCSYVDGNKRSLVVQLPRPTLQVFFVTFYRSLILKMLIATIVGFQMF